MAKAKKKPRLTIKKLCQTAAEFARKESAHDEPSMYGVTDGKAVGTYFEHKFQAYLHDRYSYAEGSSAKGIDFPELDVDMKFTSIKQPQSSCPFKSAKQKVYGLGYSLLVFVYEKTDNEQSRTGCLNVLHVIYLDKSRTADFQTTTGLRKIINNDGNKDDILAFIEERMLPLDDIQADQLADELLGTLTDIGYLTISNALQWRLQYRRIINEAGTVKGIEKLQ